MRVVRHREAVHAPSQEVFSGELDGGFELPGLLRDTPVRGRVVGTR